MVQYSYKQSSGPKGVAFSVNFAGKKLKIWTKNITKQKYW